jgi:hypothetical protein
VKRRTEKRVLRIVGAYLESKRGLCRVLGVPYPVPHSFGADTARALEKLQQFYGGSPAILPPRLPCSPYVCGARGERHKGEGACDYAPPAPKVWN